MRPRRRPHYSRPPIPIIPDCNPTKATSIALVSSDIKYAPLSLEEKAVALVVAAVAQHHHARRQRAITLTRLPRNRPLAVREQPYKNAFSKPFQRFTQYLDLHAFRGMSRMTRCSFFNLLTTLSILLHTSLTNAPLTIKGKLSLLMSELELLCVFLRVQKSSMFVTSSELETKQHTMCFMTPWMS